MANVEALLSPGGALFAEFAGPKPARDAVARLRAAGYARVESCSPFPLSDGRQEEPESKSWPGMGLVVFGAGVAGAVLGYFAQWYVNAYSYALNIGGRPAHAVPVFLISTFEGAVLLAALACVIVVLASLRLPRLWRPVFEIADVQEASLDRYWVVVALGSGGGDLVRTSRELTALGARRVVHAVTGAAGPVGASR
jgi:hypothetical protein